MQKKLIALAIAGLSSAAFAQSNVTIYGVADVSFENVRAGGGNGGPVPAAGNWSNDLAGRQRVATNASYIGFKGAESLGNGLTAVFQIENEFDFGQGANNGATGNANGNPVGNSRQSGFANRDSYIGVAGGFGTVAAGWLSSPHRSTGAKFDLMPGATGTGGSLNIIGRVNTGSVWNPINTTTGNTAGTFGNNTTTLGGADLQANNIGVIGRHSAIAYISPTFNGFNGVVAYVANETKDNQTLGGMGSGNAQRSPSAWNVALNYDNGPLAVSYSYLTIKDFGALSNTTTVAGTLAGYDLSGAEKHKAHLLGAKYTFNGATTVSFMWDKVNAALMDGPGAQTGDVTIKRSNWYIGLKHVMGAHEFTGVYAKAGKNSVGAGTRAAVFAAANLDPEAGSDAKMWSLRYAYNFSKRTSMYAQYSAVNNGANASYDFGTSSNAVTGTGNGAVASGADPRAFGVGMRHTF